MFVVLFLGGTKFKLSSKIREGAQAWIWSMISVMGKIMVDYMSSTELEALLERGKVSTSGLNYSWYNIFCRMCEDELFFMRAHYMT